MHVKYLIIGAGPTGLGAALALKELECDDFLVLERNDHPGGLSASYKDRAGFTWDFGGHVLFSHYEEFDRALNSVMGPDFLDHERVSYVRSSGTWVPYPFQNNIRHLPPRALERCLQGLRERVPLAEGETPRDFLHWILTVFGQGIADIFLKPYNFKVWATPPELMSASWIGERVPMVDLEHVLECIREEKDDVAWGPNNTFRFPAMGGTGEIYRRMADQMADHIRYQADVAFINGRNKWLRTVSGQEIAYEHLLNTGPLDLLVLRWLDRAPEAMLGAAYLLEHNSVHVSGVGIDCLDGVESPDWPPASRDKPDPRCWMYFPETDCPFYRVTNFHNYSPRNVARPGKQRALMCETSSSEHKLEDLNTLMDQSLQGLINVGLMAEEDQDRLATRFSRTKEYGYPIPTLERDRALAALHPWLETLSIHSRGRFGGWKYEVGNMDHSFMQGRQWARRLVLDEPETVYAGE